MECESVRLNRGDGFFIFARAPTYRKKLKMKQLEHFAAIKITFGQRGGEIVQLASDMARECKCRIAGWPAMWQNAELRVGQRCGERMQI